MKLIVNNSSIETKAVETSTEEKEIYNTNPVKTELYSKLLAYKQSQKKFTVKDLIKDSLK